jgi:hypothetical protein
MANGLIEFGYRNAFAIPPEAAAGTDRLSCFGSGKGSDWLRVLTGVRSLAAAGLSHGDASSPLFSRGRTGAELLARC